MTEYEEHRKKLREMCTVSASYNFDQDPRYGWVNIDSEDEKPITIVIQSGGGSYGYIFSKGEFKPTCICSAWSAGECTCSTGVWEDDY